MKNKLLFIAPNYYGFNEVVYEGFMNYSGYSNVLQHTPNDNRYIYKNFGERTLNFISKVFLGINLKNKWRQKKTLNFFNKISDIDLVVINRPDIIKDDELNLVLQKSKTSVLILWDSLEKIDLKKYIPFFDVICSFEPDDCKRYNFKKINNFYFVEDENINSQPIYDVSFLGTYDNRFQDLLHIVQGLESSGISHNIFVYKHSKMKTHCEIPKSVNLLSKIVTFKESFKFSKESKCILDIAHNNQKGLSFRVFEAIGLKKKLITNNKEIYKCDFYNPENIFVIDDVTNFVLPTDFLKTDYKELPIDVYQQYHISNWVKTILNYAK